MTNSKRLVLGWLVATSIALAFSWGAVAQVRNRVIEPSVEIPATLAAISTTTEPPKVIDLSDNEPVTTVATPTTTTEPPTTTTHAPTTTSVAPTTSDSQPPSTTTTTPPPTTTTASPPPTTVTTTTAPPQLTTSAYALVGGVVTISHSPGIVNLVAAIPQPGFSTEQLHTGPNEVRIRFESETHTSEFQAEWEHGELDVDIDDEEPDDD